MRYRIDMIIFYISVCEVQNVSLRHCSDEGRNFKLLIIAQINRMFLLVSERWSFSFSMRIRFHISSPGGTQD